MRNEIIKLKLESEKLKEETKLIVLKQKCQEQLLKQSALSYNEH